MLSIGGEAVVASRPPLGRRRRAGVTLVELLVVIAIIATLIGILLPAVQSARESARRVTCGNNLKQIGLAITAYHTSNGHFPPGFSLTNGWSVTTFILPFLEEADLYDQFDTRASMDLTNPTILANVQRVMPKYLCPTSNDPSPDQNSNPMMLIRSGVSTRWSRGGSSRIGLSNYIASNGTADQRHTVPIATGSQNGIPLKRLVGMFYYNSEVRAAQVRDGLSNTIAFTERTGVNFNGGEHQATVWAGVSHPVGALPSGGWYSIRQANTQVTDNCCRYWSQINGTGSHQMGPSSLHLGGVFVLMGDGAVRFISETIDASNWPNGLVFLLFAMADGKAVSADF